MHLAVGASLPPVATDAAPTSLPKPAASAPAQSSQPADGEATLQRSHDGSHDSLNASAASSGCSSQAATSAFAEVPENKKQVSDFATAMPRLEIPKDSPKGEGKA